MPRIKGTQPRRAPWRIPSGPLRQCTSSRCTCDYDAAKYHTFRAYDKVGSIRDKFTPGDVLSEEQWTSAFLRTSLLYHALRNEFGAALRVAVGYDGCWPDTENSRCREWLQDLHTCVTKLKTADRHDDKAFGEALYRTLMLADFIMSSVSRIVPQ